MTSFVPYSPMMTRNVFRIGFPKNNKVGILLSTYYTFCIILYYLFVVFETLKTKYFPLFMDLHRLVPIFAFYSLLLLEQICDSY